jgi:hypothetical protein
VQRRSLFVTGFAVLVVTYRCGRDWIVQLSSEKWSTLRNALRVLLTGAAQRVAANPPTAKRWRIDNRTNTTLSQRQGVAFDSSSIALLPLVGFGADYQRIVDLMRSDSELASVSMVRDERFPPSSEPLSNVEVWFGFVGSFAHRYFVDAGAVPFNEAVFDKAFDEFQNSAKSDEIEMSLVVAVPGLVLPDGAVTIKEDLVVRPVPDLELEDWLNSDSREAMTEAMVHKISAIERKYRSRRNGSNERSQAFVAAYQECARALAAVQLVADADVNALFQRLHWGAFGMFESQRMGPIARAFPTGGGSLPAAMAADLLGVFAALGTVTAKGVELGLRRWSDAQSRQRFDDRIIDCWIGLEAMLCPDSTQEVRFRASIRLAALIGMGPERRAIYDEARSSYACRSQLVHGADTSKWDLPTEASRARAWLRRVLLLALRSGLPDPKAIATVEETLLS